MSKDDAELRERAKKLSKGFIDNSNFCCGAKTGAVIGHETGYMHAHSDPQGLMLNPRVKALVECLEDILSKNPSAFSEADASKMAAAFHMKAFLALHNFNKEHRES